MLKALAAPCECGGSYLLAGRLPALLVDEVGSGPGEPQRRLPGDPDSL